MIKLLFEAFDSSLSDLQSVRFAPRQQHCYWRRRSAPGGGEIYDKIETKYKCKIIALTTQATHIPTLPAAHKPTPWKGKTHQPRTPPSAMRNTTKLALTGQKHFFSLGIHRVSRMYYNARFTLAALCTAFQAKHSPIKAAPIRLLFFDTVNFRVTFCCSEF